MKQLALTKKKPLKVFFIIALMTLSMQAWGVDCSSSNIRLSTQAEVDDFQIDYGGGGICDRVTGRLFIGGGDICDLDGLASLTSVGALYISENWNLTFTAGLANITIVERELKIHDNSALTNIDGLAKLTSMEALYIYNNAVLTNIDGLANVTNVTAWLEIYQNNALTNVAGLSNLNSYSGLI